MLWCDINVTKFYFPFAAMDISSDLTELGRTPVAVISAGVKSILDVPRTLEYLVCTKLSHVYDCK